MTCFVERLAIPPEESPVFVVLQPCPAGGTRAGSHEQEAAILFEQYFEPRPMDEKRLVCHLNHNGVLRDAIGNQ